MKATTPTVFLLLLAGVAFASFSVTPPQDIFDVLQNTSAVRLYVVDSNTTSGKIEISTSVPWAEDTTDFLNVSSGRVYTAKITIRPGMMSPGTYNAVITFASSDDVKTAKAQIRVVKTNWVYSYLLAGESYSDISYSNATVNGTGYSLVIIKGADAFLTKNGKDIVKDQAEIQMFYETYYKETLYPSNSDVEKVKAHVSAFNDSRNQLVKYSAGYGAEEACKRLTGIYYLKEGMKRDTLTVEDATLACGMVNADSPAACGDPTIVFGTRDFGIDTFNIDHNLSAYVTAISGMSLDNVAESLLAAKGNIDKTRASALSASRSKLRWDTSCPECVGACPIIPYNLSALDSASLALKSLYDRALPVKNIDTKATDLLTKTNKRISDVIGAGHKSAYSVRYEAIRPLFDNLSARVTNATSNVYSPELSSKFADMQNASASLEYIISSGDYSNIARLDAQFDSTVDRFYAAKGDVEAQLKETEGLYEEVDYYRQNATGYLIKAEMNIQPGDPASDKLNLLRSMMERTNSEFTTPLRAEMASSLEQSYLEVIEGARTLAETKPSTSILGRLIGKIVRTEKWMALTTIGLFKPLTLSESTFISEYVPVSTAGVILLVSAAFLSLFLVVYLIRNRKRLGRVRRQVMFFSLFSAATLIVALLCSGFFYYLTTIYGGEETLNLFTFEVEKANGAAVVVDETTASVSGTKEATTQIMESCAQEISDSLSRYGAPVYVVDGETCRFKGEVMNYSECDRMFAPLPVIYVRYGGTNSISFRTLYAVNATLEGNNDWLSQCLLAKAMKQ